MSDLQLREQLARINEMEANIKRKRQEIAWHPWQVFLTVLGGLAAAFAAGAAFMKFLEH